MAQDKERLHFASIWILLLISDYLIKDSIDDQSQPLEQGITETFTEGGDFVSKHLGNPFLSTGRSDTLTS